MFAYIKILIKKYIHIRALSQRSFQVQVVNKGILYVWLAYILKTLMVLDTVGKAAIVFLTSH